MGVKLVGLYVDNSQDILMYDGYIYNNPFYVETNNNMYLDYCIRHMEWVQKEYDRWYEELGRSSSTKDTFDEVFGYVQDILKEFDGAIDLYDSEESLVKQLRRTLRDIFKVRLQEIDNRNSTDKYLLTNAEYESKAYKVSGVLETTFNTDNGYGDTEAYEEVEINKEDLEEMYRDLVETFDEWLGSPRESFELETEKLLYLYFFEYLPIILRESDVEELVKRNRKKFRLSILKQVASNCEDELGVDGTLVHDTMVMLLDEYKLGIPSANDVVVRILSLTTDIGSLAGKWLPKAFTSKLGRDNNGMHKYEIELEGQDGSYSRLEIFSEYKFVESYMRDIIEEVLGDMTKEELWIEISEGTFVVNTKNFESKLLEKYGDMFMKEIPLDSENTVRFRMKELDKYI